MHSITVFTGARRLPPRELSPPLTPPRPAEWIPFGWSQEIFFDWHMLPPAAARAVNASRIGTGSVSPAVALPPPSAFSGAYSADTLFRQVFRWQVEAGWHTTYYHIKPGEAMRPGWWELTIWCASRPLRRGAPRRRSSAVNRSLACMRACVCAHRRVNDSPMLSSQVEVRSDESAERHGGAAPDPCASGPLELVTGITQQVRARNATRTCPRST